MRKVLSGLLILGIFIVYCGQISLASSIAVNKVSVSGKKILLNNKEVKILGLRCSNALLSDQAVKMLIRNLPVFQSYGINTISVFFMGSRFGDIAGYKPDCSLDEIVAGRMEQIIDAANGHGMIVIVGCLYWGTSAANSALSGWGQDEADRAISNTVVWLRDNHFHNVIVDADNEGMSHWSIESMAIAGHRADPSAVIANNGAAGSLSCDLNIHYGPKDPEKPYFDSESTPNNTPGGYWSSFSKTSGYYNYIRIGCYTEDMKKKHVGQNGIGLFQPERDCTGRYMAPVRPR